MELSKEQEVNSGVGQLVNTVKLTHGTIGKGVVNLTKKSNVWKVVIPPWVGQETQFSRATM